MVQHEIGDNFTPIAVAGAARGVPLHPTLEYVARSSYQGDSDFAFSPCHAVFAQAARLLRSDRTNKLTYQSVGAKLLSTDVAVDHTGEQFIELFNSVAGEEYFCRPDAHFTSGPVKDADTCGYAEIAFANTAETMVERAESFVAGDLTEDQRGYVIFTGEDDRPVLLRKSRGIPTALALEPISINGVVYPAGSIVRATTDEQDYLEMTALTSPNHVFDRQEVKAVPVTAIRNIGVIRLSLFAADDSERGILAKNKHSNWLDGYSQEGSKEVLDNCHLAVIRETAFQALDIIAESDS